MNIFESATAQDGERATESAHRKVELQSPADLTYLIANVTQAARAKLEKHFPPDATLEGEDVMRRRVEELLDEYIRKTFDLAKDSISVNGIDAREMEAEAQEGEELEPLDTKLAQRILGLSQQIEHETLQLANIRRKAPQETAINFAKAFEKQNEEYEARLKADQEAKLSEARATKVDIGNVERVDEMQNTWDKGRADLAALNSGLGSTMAKMEKAQKAVDVAEER